MQLLCALTNFFLQQDVESPVLHPISTENDDKAHRDDREKNCEVVDLLRAASSTLDSGN